MNLQFIAKTLNGIVSGKQVRAPGPGHSRKDDSLAIWIDDQSPDGFRVHSFAGDDWKTCRDHVRDRLGLPDWQPNSGQRLRSSCGFIPDRSSLIAAEISKQADERSRIDRALILWREAVFPIGTLVEKYLRERSLFLVDEVLAADALRYHPACPFCLDDGTTARFPAILALMRDILTDDPRAVHRTALKADGSGKADTPGLSNPKKMLGPAKGAVVKLTRDEDVMEGLGITEGIETALTVVCAGWHPVWACGSAGAIERFPVPSGIESLTIFGDADEAGIRAARLCQARWINTGRECRILLPPRDNSDWNDFARAAA
jgi:putative DNA primase/helicase